MSTQINFPRLYKRNKILVMLCNWLCFLPVYLSFCKVTFAPGTAKLNKSFVLLLKALSHFLAFLCSDTFSFPFLMTSRRPNLHWVLDVRPSPPCVHGHLHKRLCCSSFYLEIKFPRCGVGFIYFQVKRKRVCCWWHFKRLTWGRRKFCVHIIWYLCCKWG